MSTIDSDHNHYTLEQRPTAEYDLLTNSTHPDERRNPVPVASVSHSISPLPAYAYNPAAVKRPQVSTTFEQYASDASVNGFTGEPPREDDSPDPHEFYRRYQNSFARASTEGLGQGDIVVAKREDGMTRSRHQQMPTAVSARANGFDSPSLSSRVHGGHTSRYQTSPLSDKSPLGLAKSNPALSNTAKNRQTSLKDLVDRFNSNTDEVPPLPRKTTSRSTSSTSNPANFNPANNTNPATSISYARARNSSQSKSSRAGYVRKESPTDRRHAANGAKANRQRGRIDEDAKPSPKSKRIARPDPNVYASQSMTNLNPEGQNLVRKPLFGEILALSTDDKDTLGYGIPGPRRRRGSEGSMRSPNPMFPDEPNRYADEVSPSSPSAWYRGVVPTLEEIKMEKNVPSLPSGMHRRTRSDFTGGMQIRSSTPDKTSQPTQPQYLLSPNPSIGSVGTARRGSQSRIPVSTRRKSINSDSGNSTPSTRANSAADRYSGHIMFPPKGSSGLPRFNQKPRSPVRDSRSRPRLNSPRREAYNSAGQRLATSPRLAAYISAPMPKKSPPLRSSRPRQPVSSASTSASRARAVERFSGHENSGPKHAKEHKSKRPPELGGVDFAARRQKIEQAFTKTVKENERQEEIEVERQRASLALSDESQHVGAPTEILEAPSIPQQDVSDDSEHQNLDDLGEFDEDVFRTPVKDFSKSDRELTINTGHLSERSVLDLSQEDSPTLGGFNRFSHMNQIQRGDVTPPSDVEPASAVTAGTSDSVDTFFDNEPQEDSENSYQEHHTLLSHIMSMRDASPASPTSIRRAGAVEGSVSDKDDRESIQIMLGETPVLEKAPFDGLQDERAKDVSNEGSNSRWSMASWTSSIRSKDRYSGSQERDAPMERIDEHSPSRPSQPNHLSVSTAASELTPQPWSPASFASPRTGRTTLDSDTYSTINRVLDHYHDPSVVSPELMNDMQQHIFNQSPDLARQGGWDPKKVTQLYLQQLARERLAQSHALPEPLHFQFKKPADPENSTSVPTDQDEQLVSEKMVRALEQASDGDQERSRSPALSAGLYVDDGEFKPHRASLNRPDDWDMSPSIGDWIHLQAADSPLDEKPSLPPKDRRAYSKDASELPARGSSRLSGEYRPELPEIQGTGEGLGLAINITSPQEDDSPTIPAPPLPSHGPPPPPIEQVQQKTPSPPTGMRSPPSPSIYSKHVPSSIPQNHYPPSAPVNGSSDSIRQPRMPDVSGTPSAPGSISQVRSSIDTSSALTGSASTESSPSPEQKRLGRRRMVIKELVDTEHSFGQDMKVVDDIYKGTSNVIIISIEDVKTLFGNSDQIVAFSTNFLDALKQASKGVYVLPKSKRWRSNRVSTATNASGNTDESSIGGLELSDDEKDRQTFVGEAFGHHMHNLEKVYGDYLKNHEAANQKLLQLLKNPKVDIWLKECQAYAHDLTTAWSLDSLLVKPVQRLTKYPMLLQQLADVTPRDHPDHDHIQTAIRELKEITTRINEMKKRVDIMEQVTTRKRKESDVRIGLSKAIARRTEKFRQHVGLSDMVDDKEYNIVSEKFGSSYMMLQVVMKDVDLYTSEVQQYMNRFCDFITAIEAYIDVGQSSNPEIESKWRKFRMTTREMSMTALTDHVNAVKKSVIEPMISLIKIYDGPERLMQKRNKRLMDYARFRAIKDRGDKPDKKTAEQGEQFMAVNDTLKDELPKLYSMTGRLIEACLNNFVQLQVQWNIVWRRKLSQVFDDRKLPSNVAEIVQAFLGDFSFHEENVLTLGICNGSLLAEAVNLAKITSPTTLTADDGSSTYVSSTRQDSSLDLSNRRTLSVSSEASPVLPQPDFGVHNNGSFFNVENGVHMPHKPAGLRLTQNSNSSRQRMRANSALSINSPRTPEMPGSYRSYSNASTPINSGPMRPSSAQPRTATDPSPSLPRPSVETPSFNRMSEDSTHLSRPVSGSTYPQVTHSSQARAPSPSPHYSGFFSSAMPMSDSPRTQSPIDKSDRQEFNVMFLAASVYEFNIDRARTTGGHPYLTYVAGEIFDVLGEKGELWLAKNQDDVTNQVGWIWNKHFVKLAS